MKQITKATLLLLFIVFTLVTFSQKKTIQFPPATEIANLNNKEIFLNEIDNIHFYGEISNGKVIAITARDATDNSTIPLHYNIVANNNSETNGSSKSTVCRYLPTNDSTIGSSEQCYEFDCTDLIDADFRLMSSAFISENTFTRKNESDALRVYKNNDYEIFAMYSENELANYAVKPIQEKLLSIQWGTTFTTNRSNNLRRRCWIKIILIDEMGNRTSSMVYIPCTKLPVPGDGRSS